MTDQAHDWPLYRGTKVLKATSMSKAEYCLLRGWAVPTNEDDPAERGYAVEYQDGSKPSVSGFVGYVGWSPADVFEKAYQRCGSHVDRMKAELSELEDRLAKLIAFTLTPTFAELPEVKRFWMTNQRNAMTDYERALRHRLTLEEPVAETEAQA